jgi:hypothetical protein
MKTLQLGYVGDWPNQQKKTGEVQDPGYLLIDLHFIYQKRQGDSTVNDQPHPELGMRFDKLA